MEPVSQRDQEIEAVVRRYLARMARRYTPLLITALAVLLVVTLLPSTSPTSQGSPLVTGGANATGLGNAPSASPGAGAAGTGPSLGDRTSAGGQSVGGGGPASQGTTGAPSGGIAPAIGGRGATVNGGYCHPGIRQVSWSHYSPWCVPAFHGSNGGATAPGVTPTTITITYRESNSSQQAAVNAAAGAALPSDSAYIEDMNTYIKFFNTQFELYGRHVVLKPFQGQGDYLAEDQGQDLAGAQADAVTARSLGAFIDATFIVTGSVPYAQDLAAEHIVNWDGPSLPQSWYAQFAPWEYNFGFSGTKYGEWEANFICQRLAGLPAIFAGDTTYQHTVRKFGLIYDDTPTSSEVASQTQTYLFNECGVKFAKTIAYGGSASEIQSQATTMVAEMKAAGVTTVVCQCDPVTPISISQAADEQSYRPEWIVPNDLDPIARQTQQDQWSHAMAVGGQWPAEAQSEAYRVFELATHGQQPAEQYYPLAYFTLMQIYAALQTAGPDLTPATFQHAMFTLPPSTPGATNGDWAYGTDAFTSGIDAQIGWWNPNATSNFDGKKGAWESCEGGRWFRFDQASSWAPAHTQPSCFGR